LITFNAHNMVVEDVAWSFFDNNAFASVSDDMQLKLWDKRTNKSACEIVEGHTQEIMAVDYSPFDENLMITGSAD
jgi:WD40 repeat protein